MTEIQTSHDPEVLTGQTELINSTNIERIINGRNAALMQIKSLISQLDEVSKLTSSIGGDTAKEWGMRPGHRYDCWFTEKTETAMKAITRNIDRSIWRDLMLKSGMLSLMDAEARSDWHKSLDEDEIPAISEENILSTFQSLHCSKGDVFERGVVNVFKGLSWDYKTNSPCKFGKKIIINSLVSHNRWGYSLTWGYRRDQLADLERMLHLLDSKPIPDNRNDVTIRLMDHINQQRESQLYEDDYFAIRYFQKGTAHLTFKRPELTDRMNEIVAKHYPGMLAAL